MKYKLCKELGTVEDGQSRKILGVRYECKIFESGEINVVTKMNNKTGETIKNY